MPSIIREGLGTEYAQGRERTTYHHFVAQLRSGDMAGLRSGTTVVVDVGLLGLRRAGVAIHSSIIIVLLTTGFAGNIPSVSWQDLA